MGIILIEGLMQTEDKFSVLYVEDEPAARDILSAILVKKYPDINLMVAENGEQGLKAFKENLPSIVITDISMPQMDGFQLAIAIKELQPETFIIATTAHSSAQSFIDSMKNGINHYIQKPVIYRDLFAALDKCRNH
jgi:YesN/AraC family two-component response regulator